MVYYCFKYKKKLMEETTMDYSREGIKRKQRALASRGTKIKKMLGINVIKAFLICAFSGAIIGTCLGIGMFKGILATTPDISTIDVTPTGYATNLYDSEGREAEFYTYSRNICLPSWSQRIPTVPMSAWTRSPPIWPMRSSP